MADLNTIELVSANVISLVSNNVINLGGVAVETGGGSTLKEASRERKKKESEALAEALKRKHAREMAKKAESVKSKPKKVERVKAERVKADISKEIPLTEEDAQWVKETIDKPWVMPGGSPEIDNELRMRDQSARDMATRQMEEAILAHHRFLQDEDEAIAQILIMMM